MFNKLMNFVRRLNIGKIICLNPEFPNLWLIQGTGMEVMKNTKLQLNISKIMSARSKNTGTWGVNTTADTVEIKMN